MSLEDWLKSGWLKPHQTSRDEIQKLFAIVERDLRDCLNEHVSEDWRFAIAYNAARMCCTIALYCHGYKVARGQSEHYRIIQSLIHTLGKEYKEMRDYLDSCRSKRNISDYDRAGAISQQEVNELIEATNELYAALRLWVTSNYPHYA